MKKILIVEDDDCLLESIKVFLKLELPSVEVITKQNGLDALNYLQKDGEISLIILDMLMPVMNGSEFIRNLGTNKAPILMMSALNSADKISEYYHIDFISKPFDIDVFMEKVTNLL